MNKTGKVTQRKLLVFLNPDATDIGHITHYLYGKDTDKGRAAARVLVCRLRKKGWDISSREYRLTVMQHQALHSGECNTPNKRIVFSRDNQYD